MKEQNISEKPKSKTPDRGSMGNNFSDFGSSSDRTVILEELQEAENREYLNDQISESRMLNTIQNCGTINIFKTSM